MGVREPSIKQPESFEFTKEHRALAEKIIAKYPEGRQASAVMPLLDIAQRQYGGWIPVPAMDHIATLLDMPYIRVYEVASFYTMYNLQPVGKHFIQVCRTTPCWLRGSNDITKACTKKLGIGLGETTADKQFSVVEVECLGACVNAPMVQINDDYYEDLTPESMTRLLDDLASSKPVKVGPQLTRQTSAPKGELTSLTTLIKDQNPREVKASVQNGFAVDAIKKDEKKAAPKKSPAKKAATKKESVKKTAAKKPVAKKSTAKKAPVKKVAAKKSGDK